MKGWEWIVWSVLAVSSNMITAIVVDRSNRRRIKEGRVLIARIDENIASRDRLIAELRTPPPWVRQFFEIEDEPPQH